MIFTKEELMYLGFLDTPTQFSEEECEVFKFTMKNIFHASMSLCEVAVFDFSDREIRYLDEALKLNIANGREKYRGHFEDINKKVEKSLENRRFDRRTQQVQPVIHRV